MIRMAPWHHGHEASLLATPVVANGGGGGTFPGAKYYACQPPAPAGWPWCDVTEAIGNRSAAVAAAVDATELVQYVQGGAIERLGVPAPPHYGDEALHGVSAGQCPPPGRCTTAFHASVILRGRFQQAQHRPDRHTGSTGKARRPASSRKEQDAAAASIACLNHCHAQAQRHRHAFARAPCRRRAFRTALPPRPNPCRSHSGYSMSALRNRRGQMHGVHGEHSGADSPAPRWHRRPRDWRPPPSERRHFRWFLPAGPARTPAARKHAHCMSCLPPD